MHRFALRLTAAVGSAALGAGLLVPTASAAVREADFEPESVPGPIQLLNPLPPALLADPETSTEQADKQIWRDLRSLTATARSTGYIGVQVADPADGRIVYQTNDTLGRMPASNTKIVTALAALSVLGEKKRIYTQVRAGAARPKWIHLVGGGDPLLSDKDIRRLAWRTAKKLKMQAEALNRPVRKARLRFDDSLFGYQNYGVGWRGSYLPGIVAPVRALGRQGRPTMDTGTDAAKYFAYRLRKSGIPIVKVKRGITNQVRTKPLTRIGSRIGPAIDSMLRYSDNNHAEALFRLVAVHSGRQGTFEGGSEAVAEALTRYGIDPAGAVVYDGSGVSRSNRITPAALNQVTAAALRAENSTLHRMFNKNALPIAGKTGTLWDGYRRFVYPESSCAAGKALAKTGTLTGAITLSGVATAADGRPRVFSFLLNGKAAADKYGARRALDHWTAAVTGCNNSNAWKPQSLTPKKGTWLDFD